MICKIDRAGRITLPKEYREVLRIGVSEEVEILVNSEEITIRKLMFGCVFCGSRVNLVRMGEKAVCRTCTTRLYEAGKTSLLYPFSIE